MFLQKRKAAQKHTLEEHHSHNKEILKKKCILISRKKNIPEKKSNNAFVKDSTLFCNGIDCFYFIGEEEPGSMAEVSYYSYEYDPDTDSFSPESEEKLVPIEEEEEVKDTAHLLGGHILTVDTKDSPERW